MTYEKKINLIIREIEKISDVYWDENPCDELPKLTKKQIKLIDDTNRSAAVKIFEILK